MLIVGAGIGGLTAAIALERAGVGVQLFERAPELTEIGAGITLWPNAVRVLDRIGVGESVRAFAPPPWGGGLRTAAGLWLARQEAQLLHERYGGPTIPLLRAELQMALLRHFGPERVTTDSDCVGFARDSGGVTARFADGSRAWAHGLVAADGLHFGAAPAATG